MSLEEIREYVKGKMSLEEIGEYAKETLEKILKDVKEGRWIDAKSRLDELEDVRDALRYVRTDEEKRNYKGLALDLQYLAETKPFKSNDKKREGIEKVKREACKKVIEDELKNARNYIKNHSSISAMDSLLEVEEFADVGNILVPNEVSELRKRIDIIKDKFTEATGYWEREEIGALNETFKMLEYLGFEIKKENSGGLIWWLEEYLEKHDQR
jgi:hypothetical protein